MEQSADIDATSMSYDVEIDAMKEISKVFTELDVSAQERVIAWLSSRFGITSGQADRRSAEPLHAEARERSSSQAPRHFDHPAELFESAQAQTDAERALVLGYWFQVCQGASSFTSRQVNDELKHIGHGG